MWFKATYCVLTKPLSTLRFIRPNIEGLTLEISPLETLYGCQLTLSTQLMKKKWSCDANPPPLIPTAQHHSFSGNLLFIFSQSFLISFFVCLFVSYLCRKDKGNSTAEYRRIPLSELNVQLTGSGSMRRKRATDFSWTLSDLDEYTLYSIRILMYTTGDSEYSIPLEIRTAEAGSSWVVTGILGNGKSLANLGGGKDSRRGMRFRSPSLDHTSGVIFWILIWRYILATTRSRFTYIQYYCHNCYYYYYYYYYCYHFYNSTAPSSPPTGVSAVNNESSTSLLVTWSQVPYEDRNGVIRGFVIAYWLVDDPSNVQYVNMSSSTSGVSVHKRRRKRASHNSFEHTLTGLRIWTHYHVKIAAFTISRGPFSEPYMARTDEGGIAIKQSSIYLH